MVYIYTVDVVSSTSSHTISFLTHIHPYTIPSFSTKENEGLTPHPLPNYVGGFHPRYALGVGGAAGPNVCKEIVLWANCVSDGGVCGE